MARRSPVRHLTPQPSDPPAPSNREDREESSPLRKRTRARELALQCLYQLDLRGSEEVDLEGFLAESDGDPDIREFALALIRGCWQNRAEVDQQIGEVAQNWQINRMAAIDRNILRLAAHELLHRPDIPAKVSINEAIDLAKKFSTAESGAFVNGILDKIRSSRVADK